MSISPQQSSPSILNIQQVFKNSSQTPLETQILLSFLLKKPPEFILAHPETKISSLIYKKFKVLEKKRQKNYPLAYLIGQKSFYKLDFKISSAVLCPRPETELLVTEVLKEISQNKNKQKKPKKIIIIDIGTGSGAIIISLAQEIKQFWPAIFRNTKFIASDISQSALKIAKENSKIQGFQTKIKFYHSNLLATIKLQPSELLNSQLIITANLPYLTPPQIKKAPTISREPLIALDGGSDGLKYYRQLFLELASVSNLVQKKKSLQSFSIFCEINPEQKKKIELLMKKRFHNFQLKFCQDLRNKTRLAILKID